MRLAFCCRPVPLCDRCVGRERPRVAHGEAEVSQSPAPGPAGWTRARAPPPPPPTAGLPPRRCQELLLDGSSSCRPSPGPMGGRSPQAGASPPPAQSGRQRAGVVPPALGTGSHCQGAWTLLGEPTPRTGSRTRDPHVPSALLTPSVTTAFQGMSSVCQYPKVPFGGGELGQDRPGDVPWRGWGCPVCGQSPLSQPWHRGHLERLFRCGGSCGVLPGC